MKVRDKVSRETWRSLRHLYCDTVYTFARARRTPPSLTTIMNRQGSDKGTVHGYPNGLFAGHGFTKVYESLFSHRRDDPVRLLEVGIGPVEAGVGGTILYRQFHGGGSTAGWREYFSRGDIHAMDILDCSELDNDRLTTHLGDQGSRESMAKVVAKVGKPIDIIIDDGSHQSGHQQLTLACLFPALADDGVYVIEDLDWQPAEPVQPVKTIDLLNEFVATGSLPSPFLTPDEQRMLEESVVVELIHVGDERHPGMLAVLRKRS